MMKRGQIGFESLRPYFSRVVRFGKSGTKRLRINTGKIRKYVPCIHKNRYTV